MRAAALDQPFLFRARSDGFLDCRTQRLHSQSSIGGGSAVGHFHKPLKQDSKKFRLVKLLQLPIAVSAPIGLYQQRGATFLPRAP